MSDLDDLLDPMNIASALESLCVPIDSLNLDEANVRKHDEANLAAIKSSLTRFGQRFPIVVQKQGMIVRAGNGRVVAARALGWSSIAAVVVDESNVEATAFAIADNRTADLAEWDDDALAKVLNSLKEDDFDIELLGFTDAELRALCLSPKDVAQDVVPALPVEPFSKLGQLWQLGKHRLLCGDATVRVDVLRLMGGDKASLIFTDPPYGVNVTGAGGKAIAGDLTFTAIPLFFARIDDMLSDDGWCYVCGGHTNVLLYSRMFEEYFQRLPGVIVWDKGKTAVMRRNGYHSCCEFVFYSFRKGAGGTWHGSRKSGDADDVWHYRVDQGDDRQHVTQKPVEVPARAIRNSSAAGDIVCDPFLGSGATLIAAEQLDRRCYGIEIDPHYVDVIIQRWENLTGETARLLEHVVECQPSIEVTMDYGLENLLS